MCSLILESKDFWVLLLQHFPKKTLKIMPFKKHACTHALLLHEFGHSLSIQVAHGTPGMNAQLTSGRPWKPIRKWLWIMWSSRLTDSPSCFFLFQFLGVWTTATKNYFQINELLVTLIPKPTGVISLMQAQQPSPTIYIIADSYM
jgi:hypothetical protein